MIYQNPFSSATVPRRDIVQWADRKEFKEHILKFIEAEGTPWCQILLIKGDYGSGKTHSLIYIHNFCKNNNISSVLLFNPGESFTDFSVKIIDSIGFDEILLSCNEVIKKDKEKILNALEKSNISNILKIEGITIDRMLKFIFPEIDPNLALILSQAYTNRNLDLGRSWLLGKEMTASELGKLNISKSISSNDYAVKILSDVLKIYLNNKKGLTILIDELEDISNLSTPESISFQKSLRRLIDENIGNLKLIFSFTEDAFENYVTGAGNFKGKSYRALIDRLNPVESLSALSISDTKDFIYETIKRISDEPTENIITNSAINQTYNYLSKEKGKVTPRNLIIYCRDLFDDAIKNNALPISNISKYQKMDNM
jgi:hypothetical protein